MISMSSNKKFNYDGMRLNLRDLNQAPAHLMPKLNGWLLFHSGKDKTYQFDLQMLL